MAGKSRGGRRPGAGRPAGARSRATKQAKATLSDLAREHTPVALKALVDIAKSGESESAKVAAANALLDRAYGKPMQSHEHSGPQGRPIPTIDVSRLKGMTNEELDLLERALVQIGIVDGDPGGEGSPQE